MVAIEEVVTGGSRSTSSDRTSLRLSKSCRTALICCQQLGLVTHASDAHPSFICLVENLCITASLGVSTGKVHVRQCQSL